MRSPLGLEIVENCQRCKLRAGRILCDLPGPTLKALQNLGFATACSKGTVIIPQGEAAREIVVVCIGYVKISTASETGMRMCLGIAGPGTVLGLSAVISGTPHQVLIEALEPCQLRIITADRFLALLRKDNVACFATVTCLSNEVRKMNRCLRLIGLSHSATQKLAQVIIRWDMHEENEPTDKRRLRVPLAHKELAEMLGVRRETVTRLLSTFEKQELIHCRGTTLVIDDERTLRALAAPAA